MKNSVFCLYLNKSDIICELLFNVVFILHYLHEKNLILTGVSRTLVLHPNNFLNSTITNNLRKIWIQLAFPNQQRFKSKDVNGTKTGFFYCTLHI